MVKAVEDGQDVHGFHHVQCLDGLDHLPKNPLSTTVRVEPRGLWLEVVAARGLYNAEGHFLPDSAGATHVS